MAQTAGALGLLSYNFDKRPAQHDAQQEGGPEGAKPSRPKAPDEDMFAKLSEKAKTVGDDLGAKLQNRYDDWLQARRWIEDDWLQWVRAYHGLYEYNESERLQPNQSKVFVQLTRMKTDTSYNRICDLMLGTEDHWDLKPSPMPDLNKERREEIKQMIVKQMMVTPEIGGMSGNEPDEEELDKVEEEVAKKSAKRMKMTIKDQLEFARYRRRFRQMVFEMCVLGTGVFKGPMIGIETRPKWVRMKKMDDDSAFTWDLKEEEKILPKIDAPSLFDVYPDPYAFEQEKSQGVFERHVMLLHQVEELAEQPYFIKEAIEDLREKYPEGNHWETYTDIELRWVSNQNAYAGGQQRRYDVIEYWGWLTGLDLQQAGLETEDIEPNKSYYCNVWHCGGITIRATVSPTKPNHHMYQLVPYKEVLASQYGVGVPFLMKDSQETVNAAARELINNAALSSGPQVEVSVDLIELDANEDIREIVPWRVWPRAGGDLAYPAVRFTNIPDTTESMAKIIQIWRQFADEETNIPSYTHGSQAVTGAAGKTASGMSMMMGAASMDIKGVIQNIDMYMVKPFIEAMYHFNMYWSDDDSIKGDLEPEAVGSTNLLAKEIKSQRIVMLLQMTNNPIDFPIMGPENRAKLLREAGSSMDIDPDDMAPNPDEVNVPGQDMLGQDPAAGGMGTPVPGGGPPAGPAGAGGAGADATPGGPGMDQGVAPVAPVTGT